MNGTTLHSERESWLRASCSWNHDPGEIEAGHFLIATLEGTMAEIRSAIMSEDRDK